MSISKEFINRENYNVNIVRPGADNPLEMFKKSLDESEKSKKIIELNDDRIHEYIIALLQFQLQAVPDFFDCISKTQMLFSHLLVKQGIDNFNIDFSFDGTVENIKKENFSYSFKEFDISKTEELNNILIQEVNKDNTTLEYELYSDMLNKPDDEERPMKFNVFFNQKENTLDIFRKIKSKIQDDSGFESALAASGFILFAEYLSIRNIETQNTTLENLMKGEKSLNKSFYITSLRNVERYNLTFSEESSKRKFVH